MIFVHLLVHLLTLQMGHGWVAVEVNLSMVAILAGMDCTFNFLPRFILVCLLEFDKFFISPLLSINPFRVVAIMYVSKFEPGYNVFIGLKYLIRITSQESHFGSNSLLRWV